MSPRERALAEQQQRVAYRRLLKLDGRYHPAEQRDEKDWAVIFFKRTGQARLFPTIQRIAAWYHYDIYADRVFVNQRQLAASLSDEELVRFFKQWYSNVPAKSSWLAEKRREEGDTKHKPEPFRIPKTAEKMAQRLWDMIQEKADRVHGIAPQQVNPTYKQKMYVVSMADLPAALEDKQPKQCRVIIQALLDAGKESYTEEEMENFMRDLKREGKLKTKQDGFLVFRYYAPQLADRDLLDYPGRRKSDDEETDVAA